MIKKTLITLISALFIAGPALAVDTTTVTGTGVINPTSATGSDFFSEMRKVQERLAALKAQSSSDSSNVSIIQATLDKMQQDFQAELTAKLAPFRAQLDVLYNPPLDSLPTDVAQAKKDMDALYAQIQQISHDKYISTYVPLAKTLTDAQTAVTLFDKAKADVIAQINKTATDAKATLYSAYKVKVNESVILRAGLNKEISTVKNTLTRLGTSSTSTEVSVLKDKLASLTLKLTEANAQFTTMQSSFNKASVQLDTIKNQALTDLNKQRAILTSKVNAAYLAIRKYETNLNTQIAPLIKKVSVAATVFNTYRNKFVAENQDKLKVLNQQMETIVMQTQSDYQAKVLAYLKSQGLV